MFRTWLAAFFLVVILQAQPPQRLPQGGYSLPNGWRITPVGKAIPTEDLILNLTQSQDERIVVAQHGGFNPHGLLVIDVKTQAPIQRIGLKSAWLGLAWSRDGAKLYVSGGNASGPRHTSDVAPIYVFDYANGRLSEKPAAEWRDTLPAGDVYWTGLAMHPKQDLLFAGNRGADPKPGHIGVFDAQTVTPNHHALANNWVLFDNLYCDGEVSVDGHSWSNSAIATDYNEKMWPAQYGGHSKSTRASAYAPTAGHLWDLAAKKGLTYRSYGEYASRSSDGTTMDAAPGVGGLLGHVSPKFKLPGMRDTDNVRVFFEELDEYEKNFKSADSNKRLPNLVIMSLPEDHTAGTRPGSYTPRAMVANADWAVGQLVERISKSPYWAETAIFMIEDDAQNGPDHVDARRTVGLVASPYTKRGFVDSTLYTTSAMLRTIELLLGLPPMTQYDAAAMPMYNSFGVTADLTPYMAVAPRIDVNEKNTEKSWGAAASLKMNLDEVDEAPMFALNEILWKSVKGADSPMPLPVHRYWFQSRSSGQE